MQGKRKEDAFHADRKITGLGKRERGYGYVAGLNSCISVDPESNGVQPDGHGTRRLRVEKAPARRVYVAYNSPIAEGGTAVTARPESCREIGL